jgi:hypothetical protein
LRKGTCILQTQNGMDRRKRYPFRQQMDCTISFISHIDTLLSWVTQDTGALNATTMATDYLDDTNKKDAKIQTS